jgi:hypothetical protein
MRTKKAQTAMEFLMTYGWAILIVIAVVAALYAMGVFKLPGRGLGKCSPCFTAGSAIAYIDHNADTLVIRVGPSEITTTSVVNKTGAPTIPGTTGPNAPGSDINFTLAGSFKGDNDITVTYTDTGSHLDHTVTATLHGAT